MNPKGSVAIVGMGTTGFGRFADESVASLCNRALSEALMDSGLVRDQVDGLVVQIGSPRGLDYDAVAGLLGLRVRFSSQTWAHGRWCATVLTHAAMAITHGLTNYVVCLAAFKNSLFTRHGTVGYPGFSESVREGGGPHAETPHAGMGAPIAGAAMAFNRYLSRYGGDREKLAEVAIAQRNWARKNSLAAMTGPLDRDEYLNARYIVEPLRLYDCSFPVDMATALILTSAERAIDLKQRPVYLWGYQGVSAGPDEFVFGAPGLGVNEARVFDLAPDGTDQSVFGMAGVSQADIGAFYTYDGFATQVIYTLERFGFCRPGDGLDWVQGGRTGPGGELPVNTSGGHLSEGHSNGWGQTMEIARQLRGQADDRQIPGIAVAQWATTVGDSIIYGNEPS